MSLSALLEMYKYNQIFQVVEQQYPYKQNLIKKRSLFVIGQYLFKFELMASSYCVRAHSTLHNYVDVQDYAFILKKKHKKWFEFTFKAVFRIVH